MGKQNNKSNWLTILEEATAIVYINDKKVGTAWLCSNIYLISAGHLFSKSVEGQQITLSFNECLQDGQKPYRHDAELIIHKDNSNNGTDFAILKLNSPVNRHYLPISTDKTIYNGQRIISYGYGLKCSGSASGCIVGTHSCGQNKNCDLIKIESQEMCDYGYSGSAIFDESINKVIAIQIEQVVGKNTILAYPIYRLFQECYKIEDFVSVINPNRSVSARIVSTEGMQDIKQGYWSKDFIEYHFLPLLATSILNLQHQDNLDAFVRCIIVKYKREKRYTVYEAKNNDKAIGDLTGNIRKNHNLSKGRPKNYGVVGVMNKQNVTVLCDFKNKRFYKITLNGGAQEIKNINFDQVAGDQEERVALLVSPIRSSDKKIVGLLSFDFFAQNDPNKDIIAITEKNRLELDRIVFHSTYYAEVISQALNDGLFQL